MARSVWVSLRRFLGSKPTKVPEVEPPHPVDEPEELHVRHHPRAHRYSSTPDSFGLGSLILHPDGG